MKKAMLITIGTGRNRRDIASAICFSIRQHDPDYVKFLTTGKSQEETMPHILRDPVMSERQHDFVEISDENDIEAIYRQCKETIGEVVNKGYEVSVDYTSGTKAMSAGLCLAAVSKKIDSLTYIHGERDKEGRVKPGTERVLTLSPTEVYIDQEYSRFKELFNLYQFDTCINIARDVRKGSLQPEVLEKWDFLEKLASAYSAWDKFRLEESHKQLKELSESYLKNYHLEETIKRHKEVLHKDKNPYSCERIADILQNAKRREKEGKFDDAVARCYRCMEYLAQYELYKKHGRIRTGNLEPNKFKDPSIRDKYKDKKQLGLRDAYELLSDLGDPLGKTFIKERTTGKLEFLDKRNRSILAHGFKPVGETACREGLEVIERYIKTIIPNLSEIEKEVAFPTL